MRAKLGESELLSGLATRQLTSSTQALRMGGERERTLPCSMPTQGPDLVGQKAFP